MRIAVIGGGVAGLYAAWHLGRDHDVVLFERETRIGGHTDTHDVDVGDEFGPVAVDTGFIVFNRINYPLFSGWLDELGVASRASDMSFGVSCRISGLEYNATGLAALFCQRRNLVRPRFIGMVRDILRFYRRAPELLATLDASVTLGDWLPASGLGTAFADDHLIPMASALWSCPDRKILEFPFVYLLEFMQNHDMLQVSGRPAWRTVTGGSQRYVEAALTRFRGQVATRTPVRAVERTDLGVRVKTDGDLADFDQAVLACHADQALALLDGPSAAEREVLGALEFRSNETVLHTDTGRMPVRPEAWASWNVRRDVDRPDRAAISYYMNLLQGLPGGTHYIVSLDQADRIDPDRILVRRHYRHPVYTPTSRAAQRRLDEINGVDRLWYCGAGWGWGFHEDAVRSAAAVVDAFGRLAERDAA